MDDEFKKEICNLKYSSLKKDIKNLEIRIFETLKKISQLSDMTHDGQREALKTAIISVQKDLDVTTSCFKNLEKSISDLDVQVELHKTINKDIKRDNINIKNSLDIQKNKIKFLTKIVYFLFVLIALSILTGEDLSKLLTTVVKLLIT